MARIRVERATEARLAELGVHKWSTWACEPSTFDWQYTGEEMAYVQQGRVTVRTAEEEITFGAGDIVFFPNGLACTWTVHEPIRKVYTIK